jgi:hypothetical protein
MYRVWISAGMAPRPSWWKPYAAVTLALMPVALVQITVPAGAGRTAMQIIAALIPFGAMALWSVPTRLCSRLKGGAGATGAAPPSRSPVSRGRCRMPTRRIIAIGRRPGPLGASRSVHGRQARSSSRLDGGWR